MSDSRSALLILAVSLAWGAAPAHAQLLEQMGIEGQLSVHGGYRGDDLKISGKSCFCDKLRLKFDDSDVTFIGGDFSMIVARYLYMRGDVMVGWYNDANVRLDVEGDDGPGPQPFQVRGDANGDWTFGFSGGIGLQMGFFEDSLRVGVLGGYTYDEQRLQSNNEKVTLLDGLEADLPFQRIRWDTEWWGPWTGIDVTYQVNERFQLGATFEYHWMDYDGDLKLKGSSEIPDSVGDPDGDGDGYSWGVNGQYQFLDWLIVRLNLRFQDWEVGTGTPLGNENTQWQSVRFTAGVVIPF